MKKSLCAVVLLDLKIDIGRKHKKHNKLTTQFSFWQKKGFCFFKLEYSEVFLLFQINKVKTEIQHIKQQKLTALFTDFTMLREVEESDFPPTAFETILKHLSPPVSQKTNYKCTHI